MPRVCLRISDFSLLRSGNCACLWSRIGLKYFFLLLSTNLLSTKCKNILNESEHMNHFNSLFSSFAFHLTGYEFTFYKF